MDKKQNTTIPEQTITWLDMEAKEINNTTTDYEKLPAVKFEENKMTEVKVDFGKPFQKYTTTNLKGQQVTKAIIPVECNGEKKIFWLNVKNPIYQEIILSGRAGFNNFKILQTGTMEKTKYIIVK